MKDYDFLSVDEAEELARTIAKTSNSPEQIIQRLRSELGYPSRHLDPNIVFDHRENRFRFKLYCPRRATNMRRITT